MNTLNHLVGVGTLHSRDVSNGFVDAAGWEECSQGIETHWHTLTDELWQTLGDLLQHTLDEVKAVDTAVVTHVLGKASQRQCGLCVNFGIVLAVSRVQGILVLSQVDSKLNFVCSHCKNVFMVFDY